MINIYSMNILQRMMSQYTCTCRSNMDTITNTAVFKMYFSLIRNKISPTKNNNDNHLREMLTMADKVEELNKILVLDNP